MICLFNDHLLDDRHFLNRNLNTHVTTGNHDTIGCFNDLVDILDSLMVLDLGNDLDVVAAMLM